MRAFFSRAADSVPHALWLGIWTFVGGFMGYLVHVLETSDGATLYADLTSWPALRSILLTGAASGIITLWSTVKLPKDAIRQPPG